MTHYDMTLEEYQRMLAGERPRKPRNDHEHQEQAALIQWRDLNAPRIPGLRLLYAIPNGGNRDPVTAARMKAEGVLPGVPDLFLAVARQGHHGLYIEMKTDIGTLSAAQIAVIDELRVQGYAVEVCRAWGAAARVICDYLMIDSASTGLER